MANKGKHNEEEKALKDFLLDIGCLDPLVYWYSKFNLFDILKISRAEIRHSNILSWLLNPNENHGLSDSVIRGFVQYVVTSGERNGDVFDALLMDCHDFTIRREWKDIDILAVSDREKFVICIENKIGSKEGDNQLNKYYFTIKETYRDYRKVFIFLSPDGYESSMPEHWCSMGYQEVLKIIEHACRKVKLLPEVKLLIDNYIEAIRRDVVGDERLVRICTEIYAKHQKALDLIFENKPDRAADVAKILRQWATEMTKKGEMEVVLDKCNKTYTRFKTSTMSELLPDAEEAQSGWNTKNYYFYEIYNNGGNELFTQLAFSSQNIPISLKDMCERINKYYPSKQQKQNWQWRVPFSTKRSKIGEELSEEIIYEHLNKQLDEIKDFERKLKGKLEQLEEAQGKRI